MNFNSFLIKPLAAAALLATASAAHAAITVYTTLAAFNAATSAQGTDTFAGLSVTGVTLGPLNRSAGAYTYTADAAPLGDFFGAGTSANPALSTNTAADSITFNAFSAGVAAVGGNFFGTNITGVLQSGDVTLTAMDASGSVSWTIVGATTSSFLGFVSTGSMTSLSVFAVQPSPLVLWPTVDNLVLAKAVVAIPEPSTYAMLLAGLGAVGFVARRRRS
jgi:hypothetical protein